MHHRSGAVDPITALLAVSGKAAAAVVVGRHGRPPATDALLGSVGCALLQRADCPAFLMG